MTDDERAAGGPEDARPDAPAPDAPAPEAPASARADGGPGSGGPTEPATDSWVASEQPGPATTEPVAAVWEAPVPPAEPAGSPEPPGFPEPAAGASSGVVTAPPAPATASRSRGGLRQFAVGALVGGLTAALVASGVFVAVDDDGGSSATRAPNPTATATRNTSVFAKPHDLQGVLAKVEPAVVAIRTGGAVDDGLFPGNGSNSGGAGTGFVISSDGVIVTNNHVVADARGRIEVTFTDGSSLTATVLGRSPDTDLAVLKVDAKNLPVAQLGDSNTLQVGDEVVAIGNALALEGGLSVTRGIISAKGRTVPTETGATLYNMLQTDAAINPGNSGGPLVNSDGEVVGINTAIANPSDAQNVGFAISVSSARDTIDQLRAGKQVKLAFLGVATESVTPAIARELNLDTSTGAVVRRVTGDSAADKAGIKTNDVIVKVGDRDVKRADDVGAAIRDLKPGDKVSITFERAGKRQTVEATLGERPNEG